MILEFDIEREVKRINDTIKFTHPNFIGNNTKDKVLEAIENYKRVYKGQMFIYRQNVLNRASHSSYIVENLIAPIEAVLGVIISFEDGKLDVTPIEGNEIPTDYTITGRYMYNFDDMEINDFRLIFLFINHRLF